MFLTHFLSAKDFININIYTYIIDFECFKCIHKSIEISPVISFLLCPHNFSAGQGLINDKLNVYNICVCTVYMYYVYIK